MASMNNAEGSGEDDKGGAKALELECVNVQQ